MQTNNIHALNVLDNYISSLYEDKSYYAIVIYLLVFMFILHFPVSIHGNEENYFQLAHKRISPLEFSEYSAVFDASNARFVVESVIGSLVYIFGIDAAHIIARFLMACLYALGAGMFFKAMRMSVLESVAVISIFILLGQQLFGGEWIFGAVEGKTFAYALIFTALGCSIQKKWMYAIVLGGCATYLHFLVGSFWSLVCVFYALLVAGYRVSFKLLAIYALIVLPLLLVIVNDQFGQADTAGNIALANEIYVKRNLHHIFPFSSMANFKEWVPGIIILSILICWFAYVAVFDKDNKDKLTYLVLSLMLYLVLAFIISYVDRETLLFSKFYLFRPSSLIFLLAITLIIKRISDAVVDKDKVFIKAVFVAVFINAILFYVASQTHIYINNTSFTFGDELQKVVADNSLENDIVLIEPYNEYIQPNVGIPRLINRPTLVSEKFIPSNPVEILKWNELMSFRKSIMKSGCNNVLDYPVRLILVMRKSTLDNVSGCGEVIWNKKDYYLISVNPIFSPIQNNMSLKNHPLITNNPA